MKSGFQIRLLKAENASKEIITKILWRGSNALVGFTCSTTKRFMEHIRRNKSKIEQILKDNTPNKVKSDFDISSDYIDEEECFTRESTVSFTAGKEIDIHFEDVATFDDSLCRQEDVPVVQHDVPENKDEFAYPNTDITSLPEDVYSLDKTTHTDGEMLQNELSSHTRQQLTGVHSCLQYDNKNNENKSKTALKKIKTNGIQDMTASNTMFDLSTSKCNKRSLKKGTGLQHNRKTKQQYLKDKENVNITLRSTKQTKDFLQGLARIENVFNATEGSQHLPLKVFSRHQLNKVVSHVKEPDPFKIDQSNLRNLETFHLPGVQADKNKFPLVSEDDIGLDGLFQVPFNTNSSDANFAIFHRALPSSAKEECESELCKIKHRMNMMNDIHDIERHISIVQNTQGQNKLDLQVGFKETNASYLERDRSFLPAISNFAKKIISLQDENIRRNDVIEILVLNLLSSDIVKSVSVRKSSNEGSLGLTEDGHAVSSPISSLNLDDQVSGKKSCTEIGDLGTLFTSDMVTDLSLRTLKNLIFGKKVDSDMSDKEEKINSFRDLVKYLSASLNCQDDQFDNGDLGSKKGMTGGKISVGFEFTVGGKPYHLLLKKYKTIANGQSRRQYRAVVVSAEVFENAMRQWQIEHYDLTFTNLYPKTCRMFLRIPVYKGGFINRRDEKDQSDR